MLIFTTVQVLKLCRLVREHNEWTSGRSIQVDTVPGETRHPRLDIERGLGEALGNSPTYALNLKDAGCLNKYSVQTDEGAL